MSEWISVKDKKPPLDTPILGVFPCLFGGSQVFEVERINKTWTQNPAGSKRRDMTHWMPLPEPPA